MRNVLGFGLLFLVFRVDAQVAVSVDGLPADSSAILDVRSTVKGMLIPRMTSAQRGMIAMPATGLLVFDATTTSFWFFDGTAWSELVTNSAVPDQIADTDEDTRVETEQSADEDRIRYTLGGTEYFRMDPGKLQVSHTGGSVLIGRGAGFSDDLSGRNSVAIGDSALYYNGDNTQYYHSVFNTALGSRSLLYNASGFYNTGLGGHALRNNTEGHRNLAAGVWALSGNTTGAYNTAVGMEALNGNITGGHNTALGYRAGFSATGSSNVFLGSNAGYQESGSEKLYIDNSSTTTPLIYGDFASDSVVVHGKLAFKTDGSGPVYGVVAQDSHDVLQYMSYPSLIDSLQANGLSAGGSSDADWLIAGGGIPMDNTSHIYHEDSVTIGKSMPEGTGVLNVLGRIDVFSETDSTSMGIGVDALGSGNTGGHNTALGYHALRLNTAGSANTAIGRGAMYNNATGSTNTALGSYALNLNTTGSNIVAIGDSAAYHNISSNITAVGKSALFNNTNQTQNTAVGYRALYHNSASTNSALGYRALEANTTGYNNTAVGSDALATNTDGLLNTAIGHKALEDNTGGDYNTAFGAYALGSNTTANNNTAVGEAAAYNTIAGVGNSVLGASALYWNDYGDYNVAIGLQAMYVSTGDGNVAVGTSSLRLNTTGDDNTAIGYLSLHDNTTGLKNTGVGRAALSDNTTGNNRTALGYNANSTGTNYTNNTGLGYNANCTASNQIVLGNFAVSEIGGAVEWSVISDGRFKSDIQEDVVGLKFIQALRPVTYYQNLRAIDDWWAEHYHERDTLLMEQNWITEKSGIRYTGFIAQEVEEAAHLLGYDFSGVDAPKNDKDFYSLRYAEFTVPLVKAVQELATENEMLREELEELKSIVEGLQE